MGLALVVRSGTEDFQVLESLEARKQDKQNLFELNLDRPETGFLALALLDSRSDGSIVRRGVGRPQWKACFRFPKSHSFNF